MVETQSKWQDSYSKSLLANQQLNFTRKFSLSSIGSNGLGVTGEIFDACPVPVESTSR